MGLVDPELLARVTAGAAFGLAVSRLAQYLSDRQPTLSTTAGAVLVHAKALPHSPGEAARAAANAFTAAPPMRTPSQAVLGDSKSEIFPLSLPPAPPTRKLGHVGLVRSKSGGLPHSPGEAARAAANALPVLTRPVLLSKYDTEAEIEQTRADVLHHALRVPYR